MIRFRPTTNVLALVVGLLCSGQLCHSRDSVVVFNEVNYHPAGDESSLEWIELHNQQSVDVDLSAWRIDGGVQFDFELGTVISGGGYLLVAQDPEALNAATGIENAIGPFEGRLANGGEEIVLYKHNRLQVNDDLTGRRVMDRLDYGDNFPWPVAPDGSGATLAKRDPNTGTKQPENWVTSAEIGGTPGTVNFPTPDEVILEVVRLIEADASWRFNESGESFDASWANSAHPVGGNWKEGPGALGFESKIDEFIGTPLVKPTSNDPYVVTHYFERQIEIAPDMLSRIAQVSVEHLIDDGAVFYVNGVEVLRVNMPAGAVNFESLASSGEEAEWLTASGLNTTTLVAGSNLISVETHQNSRGSSDVAFGLTLDVALKPPPMEADALAGLVLSEASGADDSPFKVELTNTSATAIDAGGIVLSVSGDADREAVVPLTTQLQPGQSWILELEADTPVSNQDRLFLYTPDRDSVIDARQVAGSLRALVTEGEFKGRWLRPESPTFGNAANAFALEENIVINEVFYHAYPERGSPATPPVVGDAVLSPLDSQWRYFENVSGEGLPAGWAGESHLDWPTGAALLGREPTALDEPIRTPLSFSRPQISYYFEQEFDFDGDAESGISLRHLIDDGAVFYLNGEEIGRFNMPSGAILPTTLANQSVGNAERALSEFPDARPVPGTNRLSIEVHQSNIGSSDIILGAEILGKAIIAPGDPGRPYTESAEEWIELHNRSDEEIDLSGWMLDSGLQYEFPEGATLAAGGYLVVSNDPPSLRQKYNTLNNVVGPFSGQLSNRGEKIALLDASGNPADEVTYSDSGRWPTFADGSGSSLELKEAAASNQFPEAWAASENSSKSDWHTVTYRGVAENDRQGNNVFHEFLIGLLDAGEFLLDDVSVIESPGGANIEFIQNGDFEMDTLGELADKWRAVGTHGSHDQTIVVVDPDNPGNKCLHVVSTGPTEDKHNKLETTYADNERVSVGTEYEISFRAKWLGGSNQVNTRLYFNYLQRTSLLPVPTSWGSPGAPNSQRIDNIGPVYSDMSHEPAVPETGESVTVSILARDNDGIASMELFYAPDGDDFVSTPMIADSSGRYSSTVPGQASSEVVQFFVEGTDSAGTVTHFPPGGETSRALFKVNDDRAELDEVHNLRIIMLNDDRVFLFRNTNRMSNDRIGATVIYDEKTVFHNVGVRLKGSAFGRYNAQHYGYNIQFDPAHLFRGVHRTISIERSPPLKEILAKHLLTQAGGPGFSFYEDVGRVIAPAERESGPCIFSLARHTSEFWEGLDGDSPTSGTLYNHELLYNPNGASGGSEGLKINNPYNHNGGRYDFDGRGIDKEAYRWGFQIRSNRGRDDYSSIVGAGLAMSQSGQSMESAAAEFIDFDQWARGLAALSLVGGDDTYTRIWEHNLRYYARPTDGKLIVLPWDLDRAFQLSTSSPAIGGNAVGRLFKRDVPERLFFGHARDMIDTVFNSDYATRWANHYGELTGSRYRTEASYVGNRANYIAGRIPDEIPFAITTDNDVTFEGTTATIRGRGWVDVVSMVTDLGIEYSPRWIDAENWEVEATLEPGQNLIELTAIDHRGRVVGTDEVRLTSSATSSAPSSRNLAICEIHYHPTDPTDAEIAAGFDDPEMFEFVEIHNFSDSAVELAGVHFSDGITFEFSNDTAPLPAGGRTVLVANEPAARLRYGESIVASVTGEYAGSLRNSGEGIGLESSNGTVIQEFAYNDQHPWPTSADQLGFSLVLMAAETLPDPDEATNWRPSALVGGNPGTTDRLPFTQGSEDLADYGVIDATLHLTDNGTVLLELVQEIGADDVIVTPEFSTDLTTWIPAGTEQFVERINHEDEFMSLFYESSAAAEGTMQHFARLKVRLRGE